MLQHGVPHSLTDTWYSKKCVRSHENHNNAINNRGLLKNDPGSCWLSCILMCNDVHYEGLDRRQCQVHDPGYMEIWAKSTVFLILSLNILLEHKKIGQNN